MLEAKCFQVVDQIMGGYPRLVSPLPDLDLYDSVGETLVANDNLKGDSNQIGVIEFYACSIRTIIP